MNEYTEYKTEPPKSSPRKSHTKSKSKLQSFEQQELDSISFQRDQVYGTSSGIKQDPENIDDSANVTPRGGGMYIPKHLRKSKDFISPRYKEAKKLTTAVENLATKLDGIKQKRPLPNTGAQGPVNRGYFGNSNDDES